LDLLEQGGETLGEVLINDVMRSAQQALLESVIEELRKERELS